ncbi:S-layer homology domain-containing protein [Cohnella candidum]|uniref:S-layer homology domain-containing protein n=1 Tax=Cohnella candidum TaxID=2674991 RepID=A0A3G3K2L0_9BACL|nr:S-layer homology domain-containing protein [Cohnella candidum]AYQ74785.1 S-layer homology domain-containing protein [Cohnella candidum]
MPRPILRKKWLSVTLAAGLLLTAYAPVGFAAESNQTQAETNSSVPGYADVPDHAWYAKAVNGWIALGILKPEQGDKFQPDFVTTRGDFAFLLAYSLGLTPSSKPAAFKDLSGNDLAGYITALQESGLANGYADGTFRPSAPVTRAEAARWIAAARKLQTESPTSRRFRDVSPDSWYSGSVETLLKAGIVSGKSDDRFAPADSISRAETISMLDRSFFSPPLIQDVRADGVIMIDGRAYHADESISGIFQWSNKAVLQNAAIQFTADGNKIVSVEYLMIGYKGALAREDKPLVLDADGNAINGIVMVDADHVTLANLEVKGDLILGRGFQSDFLAYHVSVKGQTVYLEDFGRSKDQVSNLDLQDSDLGKVVLGNSVNVRQVHIDSGKLSKTGDKPAKVIRVSAEPEKTGKLNLPTATPKLPPLGIPILPTGTEKPPTGPPVLAPGLHLQVTDGAIIATNSGGASLFKPVSSAMCRT